MNNSPLPLIRVDMNGRGHWDVASSDPAFHDTYRSLEDARRVARRRAAHQPRYELVVCDAYHRVVQHEILENSVER